MLHSFHMNSSLAWTLSQQGPPHLCVPFHARGMQRRAAAWREWELGEEEAAARAAEEEAQAARIAEQKAKLAAKLEAWREADAKEAEAAATAASRSKRRREKGGKKVFWYKSKEQLEML